MSDKFTQGTIIEYIRSTKYPEIKCQGIVISARCDLAQEKNKSIPLFISYEYRGKETII